LIDRPHDGVDPSRNNPMRRRCGTIFLAVIGQFFADSP
jgi:hypothetical protein